MPEIRLKTPGDQDWIERILEELWGGRNIVAHCRVFDASGLPALIAGGDHGPGHGLLTFAVDPPQAEIVTLNALIPGKGIGTALVAALAAELARQGLREIRVTTMNDNLDALRFYQRRGFRIAAVRPGAVDDARRIKPSIPTVGNHGIPRHDEIELVRVLG